ncbi:MAG TPA: hypothetical protein VMU84_07535 [Thermoanaerobaculia bacterium]|nr:hypothetical protein [Thermoanaerobaculia bacterium]
METNRLLLDMTSADEETRADARDELGMRIDDAIARAILDIASSDAADEIRADALVTFGPVIEICGIDFDDEEFDFGPEIEPPVSRETFETIVGELNALYADEAQPKIVRRRAFENLIRDPQPPHIKEVRKHFASSDSDWRKTAVFAMGQIPGFDRELLDTLGNAEGDLLYEAIRAAANMEIRQAAKPIRAIAADDSAAIDLRVAAIFALPNVDRDCFELLDELKDSEDAEIAEAAEESLEELGFAQQMGDFEEE